jgi:choline dehydrogenase
VEADVGFPSRRSDKIEDGSRNKVAIMIPLLFSAAVALGLTVLSSAKLLGSSFGVPGTNATYDYVVVGGGTAGLTIAARIAEANIGTVAVIEAGTFYEISNGNLSQVPALDGMFSSTGLHDWHPMIDWGYITTPQAVCLLFQPSHSEC